MKRLITVLLASVFLVSVVLSGCAPAAPAPDKAAAVAPAGPGGPPAGPGGPAALKPATPYPVSPAPSVKSYVHKGDFSVMTVGTGCPDTIVGRSGPSTLVQYKGKYFLVDIGDGTSFRLVEAGLDLTKINNIFLTHMHADHTDGYWKFMIESWTLGRKDANLIGLKGAQALQDTIKTVFANDIKYRIPKAGGNTNGIYENVKVKELPEANAEFVIDGVKITASPTIHAVPNLAYRFDVDGKSIVVSGDTSYSENLIKLAMNADVFVVDSGKVANLAYLGPGEFKPPPGAPPAGGAAPAGGPPAGGPPAGGPPAGGPPPAGGAPAGPPPAGGAPAGPPPAGGAPAGPPPAADPATYVAKEVTGKSHAELADVAIMAEKAHVKKLVLTHYPPFAVDQEETLRQYKMFYKGEVVFGQDMLEVTP